MMNAHGIVGRDGAIEEGPGFAIVVFFAQFLERLGAIPK